MAVIVDADAYDRIVETAEEVVDRRELQAARDEDDYMPWDEVKADLGLDRATVSRLLDGRRRPSPGCPARSSSVVHEDGSEGEAGPGDAYVIQPGHDVWVVGDEPLVAYEFDSSTAQNYAQPS